MPSDLLRALGVADDPRLVPVPAGPADRSKGVVVTSSPASGEPIAAVRLDDAAAYERTIGEAVETFRKWREVPAPVRGQVVRAIGEEFRRRREPLGELVALEM